MMFCSRNVPKTEVHSQRVTANKEVLFYLNAVNIERKFRLYKVHTTVNLSNSCVNIEGVDESYVIRAEQELRNEIAILHIQQSAVSDEWVKCFSLMNKADIIKCFRSERLRAGLDVRDSKLYVCSNSPGEAQKGTYIVKKFICLRTYPADRKLSSSHHQLIVSSPEQWQLYIEDLKKQFPGVVIVYDDVDSVIRIASPALNNMSAIVNQLANYFKHLRNKFTTIQFQDEDELMLIELNSHQILAAHPGVELAFDDKKKICTLTSSQDVEPAAVDMLQMTAGRVSHTESEQSRAFCNWIRSVDKGRRKLADI